MSSQARNYTDQPRAFDKQDPLFTMSGDEQLQVDLFKQWWLYAHPPNDGTDLYSADQGFFIRRENQYTAGTNDGSIAKAKGLRANTKAIFNFVPNIVATNRQYLSNGAAHTGIRVLSESGEVDEIVTPEAQKLLKKQWPSFLAELLENGLVTGNAYIEVVLEENGNVFFNVLYSNYVFITRNPDDIRKIDRVEIKYSYEDEEGKTHQYYRLVTDVEIVEEIDGVKTRDTDNPFGFIPIVHIRNLPVPGKTYGDNCFFQSISDIDQLNEMVGDWIYALSLYGHPTPVIAGSSVDGELKMDVGQVIELPDGGKVDLLEFSQHGDIMERIATLAKLIKKKIPEFDLNEIETGSVNLSGYAIQLRLSNIISKIQYEQQQYEQGIAEAIEIAFNILSPTGERVDLDIEVDMGPALPSNLMELAEQKEKLKNNGWITDEQAMRELGRTEQEIAEVIEKIEQDFEFAEQLEKFNEDPDKDTEEFIIDSPAEKGDVFKLNKRTGEIEKQ